MIEPLDYDLAKNLALWQNAATVKAPPLLSLGELVRKLREDREWNQGELASRAGMHLTTISDLENNKNSKRETIEKVAAALEITPGELFMMASGTTSTRGGESMVAESEANHLDHDVTKYQKNAIPVVAEGEASPSGLNWFDEGTPLNAIEDWISRPYDMSDPRAYGVKVRQDSMVPVLRPGSRVVVSPNAPVKNGDIAYVQLRSGERLLKIAERAGGGWTLRSYNPAYESRFVMNEEILHIHRVMWMKV